MDRYVIIIGVVALYLIIGAFAAGLFSDDSTGGRFWVFFWLPTLVMIIIATPFVLTYKLGNLIHDRWKERKNK